MRSWTCPTYFSPPIFYSSKQTCPTCRWDRFARFFSKDTRSAGHTALIHLCTSPLPRSCLTRIFWEDPQIWDMTHWCGTWLTDMWRDSVGQVRMILLKRYTLVMTPLTCIWMSLVPYEWVMSHANLSHLQIFSTAQSKAQSQSSYRVVGSIKLQVSLAEYRLFYRALWQKIPIVLSFSTAQSKVRSQSSCRVAMISRLLKIIGLFCGISSLL